VFDDSNNKSIKDARIEVYAGTAGVTEKILDANTDKDGSAKVPLNPQQYGLRISAYRFHQLYSTLNLTEPQTTTTTTTSTTTTTTTTQTTSTLKHFILEVTTTSTATTTTQAEQQITGNAIQTETKNRKQTNYLPYAIAAMIIALPLAAWLRK